MKDIIYTHIRFQKEQTHLRLNPQVVILLNQDGLLREFAAFLKIKNECVNSRVYNCTGSRIASILGVSRQTADRYMKVFLKEKWVHYVGSMLHLEKIKTISSKYIEQNPNEFHRKANVYFGVKGAALKELVIKLKYLIIKQKELNTNFLLDLRRDLSNVKGSVEFTRLKRKADKYKLDGYKGEPIGAIDYRLQISFKGLSELFGCSVGSAYNLLKKMTRKELLKKYTRREVLLKNVPSGIWESLLQHKAEYKKCFYLHGNVIRNHSNKYAMIS